MLACASDIPGLTLKEQTANLDKFSTYGPKSLCSLTLTAADFPLRVSMRVGVWHDVR